MTYGALTLVDVEVLEQVLFEFKAAGRMKFLEIGVYEGHTSRGIRDFCAANGIELEYWGIESGTLCVPTRPFPDAHFVIGESREVFMHLPDDFDVVFIDGDHTLNAVILDTLHYGAKVKPGGFLLCHDTSPEIQFKMAEPNRNYPEHPWFHNAVNAAHAMLGFPTKEWREWLSRYQAGCAYGGMTVYRKENQ